MSGRHNQISLLLIGFQHLNSILSQLNSAYSSVFFFIREINYGWCLRYLHSSGASFVFHFLSAPANPLCE